MSAWPGKYVIGLTGNIATGKSVVRKMLEHLGAYGIDADALAHRVIAKGAPGYKPVLEEFGKWILGSDGQIDRTKLGRIVFTDPDAMARLEAIIHPLVKQAVDVLARRSKQKVLVVEAIKLLESSMRSDCDAVWVTHAPAEIQLTRLVQKRGMSTEAARQRINAQPFQEEKLASANIVIQNDGLFEDTWKQVVKTWQEIFPAIETDPLRPVTVVKGEMVVERARPQQADEIAAYLTRHSDGRKSYSREDVMTAFGEKAFLLLRIDRELVGLVGWQVENLVARTSDVYMEPGLSLEEAMRVLIEEVEGASRELQCEAVLLFLPKKMARRENVWHALQYEQRTIQSLGVRAWQEAAKESMPPETVMLFKQLRKDRVLRPV